MLVCQLPFDQPTSHFYQLFALLKIYIPVPLMVDVKWQIKSYPYSNCIQYLLSGIYYTICDALALAGLLTCSFNRCMNVIQTWWSGYHELVDGDVGIEDGRNEEGIGKRFYTLITDYSFTDYPF